jgi:hypothetical protein
MPVNRLITRFVIAGERSASPPGDDADCREELFGRVVLEHEAAGTGAERLVDMLVEVERRQDQDPGVSSAARMRRVASSPSSSGMRMSIRTTVGSKRAALS